MQGVPSQPVPSRDGQHAPVEINHDVDTLGEVGEDEMPPKENAGTDEEELEYQKKAHNLHASRKAIQKYGTTDGCPACSATNRRGHVLGNVGRNRSAICRARIVEAMLEDPEHLRFVYKHEPQQQAGDVEIFIEEQVAEKRRKMAKAIQSIEQRERYNRGSLSQQLARTLLKNLLAKIELAEAYSPPTVTRMVEQMGLRAGWALDLRT